jgi:DNA-binding MarR family transcriptional regulator
MPPRSTRTTARRRAANAGSAHDIAQLVLDGVRRLDRGLRLAARRVERETGLSAAQLFVLRHLTEAPASSLNDLASRTYTDRSSVSAVVDRLEKAGFVTRTVASHDRRQQEVQITGRGVRKLEAAPPAPTDLLLDGIAKLPRSSAVRLGKGLAALNAAIGFEEAELLFNGE